MPIMKKPRVEFNSRGPSGNIHHILALVREALRKQQRIQEFNDLRDEVYNSESYTAALVKIREKIDLVDLDGEK